MSKTQKQQDILENWKNIFKEILEENIVKIPEDKKNCYYIQVWRPWQNKTIIKLYDEEDFEKHHTKIVNNMIKALNNYWTK